MLKAFPFNMERRITWERLRAMNLKDRERYMENLEKIVLRKKKSSNKMRRRVKISNLSRCGDTSMSTPVSYLMEDASELITEFKTYRTKRVLQEHGKSIGAHNQIEQFNKPAGCIDRPSNFCSLYEKLVPFQKTTGYNYQRMAFMNEALRKGSSGSFRSIIIESPLIKEKQETCLMNITCKLKGEKLSV